MGGTPFPDGEDHGGADDEFASVVFDESFIRAASVHEPTAQERLLAAAQARAEADAARARVGGVDDDADEDARYAEELWEPPGYRPGELRTGRGEARYVPGMSPYRYRGRTRWHRTVAWVLALVMGIGVVALTFTAVYRGAGGGNRQPPTPTSSGRVDTPHPPVGVTSSAVP